MTDPTEDQELWDRATLGKQVEAFWSSRIGEYLRDRANSEYVDYIGKLKVVDPTDARAVMHAQGRVWQAENFEQWLSELVLDGLKSLEIIEGNEDE